MKNELQKLAEEFGYIVISPNGFAPSGGFGAPPPARPAGTAPARPAGAPSPPDPKTIAYSEQDVLNVLEIVEKEYTADTAKVFITGNSMGAIGTTHLALKYPDKWLAMAPSEGGFQVDRYSGTYKVKGALLVHKQDAAAPDVEKKSLEMVDYLAAQGVEGHTISVPNTVHENVWFFTLPLIFHFFDKFAQGR